MFEFLLIEMAFVYILYSKSTILKHTRTNKSARLKYIIYVFYNTLTIPLYAKFKY